MLNIIDLVMRGLYDFLHLYLIYAGIQNGQRQRVEGAENATHGSAEPSQQPREIQEETEHRDHLYVNISEAIVTDGNEDYEAKILKVIIILISVSTGGVFGFLQVQIGNEKIKSELKLNYIACNVSLCASIVVAIVSVILTCMPWKSARKTLILRLIIGVSLVLIMADFGLAIAFNLRRG